MRCPMCAEAELTPTYRHGIEVDVCPRCKGVWLDRGELEKVLDALDAQIDASGAPAGPAPGAAPSSPLPPPPGARPPAPPPRDDRYDDRRPHDDRYDERPWMDPRVLGGRGWAKGSRPPAGYGKKGKRHKHKSFLAEIVGELM